jgi:hypothetical protein
MVKRALASGHQSEGGRQPSIHGTIHRQPNVGRKHVRQSQGGIPDLVACTGQQVESDHTAPGEYPRTDLDAHKAGELVQRQLRQHHIEGSGQLSEKIYAKPYVLIFQRD